MTLILAALFLAPPWSAAQGARETYDTHGESVEAGFVDFDLGNGRTC